MLDYFKSKWAEVHDKVKQVVFVGLAMLALALLDVFSGVDWTDGLGPFAPFVAVALAAGFAWLKKEVTAFLNRSETPSDTPPPVAPF